MIEKEFLGVGLYELLDAARILQVKPHKLKAWVREFTYKVRGIQYVRKPLLAPRLEIEGQTILTFLELIELLFVSLFRQHGVSMPTIRKAALRASKMFNTEFPFAVKQFDTDGKEIFVTLAVERGGIATEEREFLEEVIRSQLFFDDLVRPFFRRIEYGYELNSSAQLYWPLGKDHRIVLDPTRKFGQPIDNETAVPTRALYRALLAHGKASGKEDYEAVARWFDIPIDAVTAAVKYELLHEVA